MSLLQETSERVFNYETQELPVLGNTLEETAEEANLPFVGVLPDFSQRLLADRFVLISQLARTNSSTVYTSFDLLDEDFVVTKFFMEADELQRRRVNREIQSHHMTTASTPNILPALASGSVKEEGKVYRYLITAVAEKRTLSEVPKPTSLAELREVAKVGADAAFALEALHAKYGLVHGDVKPANVFINEKNHGWLGDLGIVQHIGEDLQQAGIAPEYGTICTPAFAPPEVLEVVGNKPDTKVDSYALSATLFKVITGIQPYGGDTAYQVLDTMHHAEHAPNPQDYNPIVPSKLGFAIERGLSTHPEERPEVAELGKCLLELVA